MRTAIKYAPLNLEEVIYPSLAVKKRIAAYAKGQLEGHILLWGPNGTGKTTVANLLPYAIGGEDALVEDKEFDELLSNKDLKQYLLNACSMSGLYGQGKFFIVFNEFDNAKVNLSKLWTAMDRCAEQLMVIITTNLPMNVHQSVRSRCDLIDFSKLSARQVLPRAQQILQAEEVNLPDAQVLYYLTQIEHQADLRKYFMKLDEIIFLSSSGQPLPPVASAAFSTKPSFTVISASSI